MPSSAFTDAHKLLIQALTAARKAAGLKQTELAAKLGKDQSFISNIERGERRVDVIEFIALSRAIGVDAADLLEKLATDLPAQIDI